MGQTASDSRASLTWAVGTAVTAYALAALVVALNPGGVFTNWFASTGPGAGTLGVVSYGLWDSMSPVGQAFVVAMFALPFVAGIAVSQMKAPETPAAVVVTGSLAVGLVVSVVVAMVSRSLMGGDNAVAESMRELAKFLAVAIVPAGLSTVVAVSSREK
jgi:hypothetical protein